MAWSRKIFSPNQIWILFNVKIVSFMALNIHSISSHKIHSSCPKTKSIHEYIPPYPHEVEEEEKNVSGWENLLIDKLCILWSSLAVGIFLPSLRILTFGNFSKENFCLVSHCDWSFDHNEQDDDIKWTPRCEQWIYSPICERKLPWISVLYVLCAADWLHSAEHDVFGMGKVLRRKLQTNSPDVHRKPARFN